jgi:serine/threonine protein kinase
VTQETPGARSETLAQRLKRGPLEAEAALAVLRSLLETLAVLHADGATHARITPETISVTPNGRVALIGRNPASPARSSAGAGGLHAARKPAVAQTLAVAGGASPAAGPPSAAAEHPAALSELAFCRREYLAPEQLAGLPADARADVFAVGVILYEMLTGSNQVEPDRLARLPQPFRAPVRKALSVDRERRFADAREFLGALEGPQARPAFTAGRAASGPAPAPTLPPASAPTLRRSLSGRRLRYVAAAVAVVIIAAVAVGLILGLGGGSPALTETTTTLAGIASATSTTQAATPTTASTSATIPTSTTGPGATTTSTSPSTTSSLATTTTAAAAPPATTRFEQTASQLAFSAGWRLGTSASYSGRSLRFAGGSGASVTVAFDGTYLAWVGKKSPDYGVARVTLDGSAPRTIDLYSATAKYGQKLWESGLLAAGVHQVSIEWTGDKNAAATGTNICVDAFDVAGKLVAVKRIEQTDARLKWKGTWTRTSTTAASGGSFQSANAQGASVTVNFTGQGLALVAAAGPKYGKAKLTLDGKTTFTVDLYSAKDQFGRVVWASGPLAAGNHTLVIDWTGEKNPAATGTGINLDAVVLAGDLR